MNAKLTFAISTDAEDIPRALSLTDTLTILSDSNSSLRFFPPTLTTRVARALVTTRPPTDTPMSAVTDGDGCSRTLQMSTTAQPSNVIPDSSTNSNFLSQPKVGMSPSNTFTRSALKAILSTTLVNCWSNSAKNKA